MQLTEPACDWLAWFIDWTSQGAEGMTPNNDGIYQSALRPTRPGTLTGHCSPAGSLNETQPSDAYQYLLPVLQAPIKTRPKADDHRPSSRWRWRRGRPYRRPYSRH